MIRLWRDRNECATRPALPTLVEEMDLQAKMSDVISAKTREKHSNLNPQRSSGRMFREGFAKVGLEGWLGVHGTGSWKRDRFIRDQAGMQVST